MYWKLRCLNLCLWQEICIATRSRVIIDCSTKVLTFAWTQRPVAAILWKHALMVHPWRVWSLPDNAPKHRLMRRGNREVESLLEAPSGWEVRIEYYGQRKWTLVTVVNLNKPKELWGLNQKVGGWFGVIAEIPTRAKFPPADRVGLRYSLSNTRNVVTSCLRPRAG